MKKLVAYYSRADENYFGGTKKYIEVGNTEKAAKMIADMIGADLYKIKQIHPYSADYDTCVKEAKDDLRKNVRPELKNMLETEDVDGMRAMMRYSTARREKFDKK